MTEKQTMITRDHVSSGVVVEEQVHKFATTASDIGLRAGEWPEKLEAEAGVGNSQPFVRSSRKLNADEDELIYVCYVQLLGCLSLIVYND